MSPFLRFVGYFLLFALHIAFALAFYGIAMDSGPKRGSLDGVLAFIIGGIMGFPWSLLALGAGSEPLINAAPVINYLLLWWLTFARMRREWTGVTFPRLFIAVMPALVLFAILHLAFASMMHGLQKQSFIDFAAFLAPTLALANTWVLARASSLNGLLARGLILPAVLSIGGYVLLLNEGRIGREMVAVISLGIVLLLVPAFRAFVFRRREPSPNPGR